MRNRYDTKCANAGSHTLIINDNNITDNYYNVMFLFKKI